MKKLIGYMKPEIRLVELRFEVPTCQTLVDSKTVVGGTVQGEGDKEPVDGFDAPIFRPGIWDEESGLWSDD